MKVFVLMRSSNYDVEVEAIYSTNELAIKACESFSKYAENSIYWIHNGWMYWIDEFELDPDDKQLKAATTKQFTIASMERKSHAGI